MTAPDEPPQVRVIAMPADANPAGDIFGGWLMAHMDQAGASVALRRARGRVATVAVEAMAFHLPVRVATRSACMAACSAWAAHRSACMSRPGAATARRKTPRA